MTRPKRTCAEPGCPALVAKGHCLRHNQRRDERRESFAKRGYDARWVKLRKIVLARDPVCKICNEVASTEVDHIVPKRPDQHAADVTEEELQGTCKPCHSSKTRAENAPKRRRRRKSIEGNDLGRAGGGQNSRADGDQAVPTP